MHYSNIGFALGFFLITLGIPLDGYAPEPRNALLDESEKEQSPSQTAGSEHHQKSRHPFHWIWNDFLSDNDVLSRIVRERVSGYRRITATNVLEHETRKKIFALICENPGIDLTRLAILSKSNENTLRYHIDRLAETKCISIFDQGKSYHFFENHNTFSMKEQLFLSRSSSGLTGKILTLVQHNPGISRREIAECLGIASPTVTRTVRHLVYEGCIQLVKDGKYTRHYILKENLQNNLN